MKRLLFLHACVLLLWTQTAFADSAETKKKIIVKELHDAIELVCPDGFNFTNSVNGTKRLEYKDENSGEYKCEGSGESIYVKFRTCDNCIELDTTSIAGMAVGDLVATCVIGVAVYLFASVVRSGPATSNSKRSDRQPPRPHEPRGASNEPYQRLAFKSPQDQYDQLKPKR